MKNAEIVKVLQEIADLLEIKQESPFKIRAYRKAVRSIEHLPVELEQLVKEDRLREVPGIGDALEKKITELVNTGHLKYYEELQAGLPLGAITLMKIPGIGPRTALRLAAEQGISSVEELEAAIASGKVADMFRMGEKSAENILRHIQSLRTRDKRIPIGIALPLAEEIMTALQQSCHLEHLTPAGSLRRFRDTIGDIDLMGTSEDASPPIDAFATLPQVKEVIARGVTKASVYTYRDIQVDFRVVEHDAYGSLLQYFTGSQQHNIALRERGQRQGLKLSEYGITDLSSDTLEKFSTEEEFYQRLGLQYIPPEIREGGKEIEEAAAGRLPDLLEPADLKGDLHVHTNWSDGSHSLEEMALAARAAGYQYIAITDHSKGLGIARGLTEERLRDQTEAIKELNSRLEGIYVLAGVEVDIRADGSLDLPDGVLRELDVVIAAVHSALNQEETRMTQRILRAIENPCVSIIGHPTGRLLGEREPTALDMEVLLRAAAQNGTVMEINAMPDRLDLKDLHVSRARELGVRLSLGTDAHSMDHLRYMRFGVGVARRGWCEPRHIINTYPLPELLHLLHGASNRS